MRLWPVSELVRQEGHFLKRGGSLHNGFASFDGFGGSGEHLALPLLVLQNIVPRGNCDSLAVLAVVTVSGREGSLL